MQGAPGTSNSYDVGVSALGIDTLVMGQKLTEGSVIRRRDNMDGSTLRVDDAASGAGGCKHPALETLARSRTAGLHEETECNQAGLDHSCPRIESGDGYNNGNPSRVGLSVEQVKTSEKASSVERRDVERHDEDLYWISVQVNVIGESSDECVGVDVASSHGLDALREGPVRWTHRTDMHPFRH
ncbi:hypothetical protein F443_18710 [Phytophthora nicotianae P1569]|uniref:Uncharacterized protein n=1 Tax=Phytophthora nicotianae P1569 TaxID=1317065 RepID=V9E746_PHYNI|nr:hypothetical protein F443_18710 [Phytophthora nicotianae P1569]